MAQHDVQMNYDVMEQMADILRSGEQQFEDTQRTVQQIVSMLEGGALLGAAGEKLAETLRSKLSTNLQSGAQKMSDLAKDLEAAMSDMQSADSTAAGKF